MQAMERSASIPFSIESVRPEPDAAPRDLELASPELDLAFLVESYSRTLFRVAYSVLRSRADAEDVVQEVFVRVIAHQNSLENVREMRVWLVRIAWNLAIDARRRLRPEQLDAQFAESLAVRNAAADEALSQSQSVHSVLREIERLPRGERDCLLLSAVEELDTAEMAAVLKRSESAVRALLFRARTRLRERLQAKEIRHDQRR